MTSFEKEVIDRLGRIETKLDNDFQDINGENGLLTRMRGAETEITKLKATKKESGRFLEYVAWIITAITAIYAAFFKN